MIEPAGSIRRLTAAVVLDDAVERHQQNGKWVEVRHKRQPEELRMINELAQAAIGFNTDRGDVISVQNLSFDRPDTDDLPPASLLDRLRKGLSDYSSVVRYTALLGLFVLVYFLMIRPIQKKVLVTPLPLPVKPGILPHAETEEGMLESSAAIAQRSASLKSQLKEPESSTTAVRAWLREETQ